MLSLICNITIFVHSKFKFKCCIVNKLYSKLTNLKLSNCNIVTETFCQVLDDVIETATSKDNMQNNSYIGFLEAFFISESKVSCTFNEHQMRDRLC